MEQALKTDEKLYSARFEKSGLIRFDSTCRVIGAEDSRPFLRKCLEKTGKKGIGYIGSKGKKTVSLTWRKDWGGRHVKSPKKWTFKEVPEQTNSY